MCGATVSMCSRSSKRIIRSVRTITSVWMATSRRLLPARRALELIEREYAVKQEELGLKRAAKQNELEAARIELAHRELERQDVEAGEP